MLLLGLMLLDMYADDLVNHSREHNHPDINFGIPNSLVNAAPCLKETNKIFQTRYRAIANKPPTPPLFPRHLGPQGHVSISITSLSLSAVAVAVAVSTWH